MLIYVGKQWIKLIEIFLLFVSNLRRYCHHLIQTVLTDDSKEIEYVGIHPELPHRFLGKINLSHMLYDIQTRLYKCRSGLVIYYDRRCKKRQDGREALYSWYTVEIKQAYISFTVRGRDGLVQLSGRDNDDLPWIEHIFLIVNSYCIYVFDRRNYLYGRVPVCLKTSGDIILPKPDIWTAHEINSFTVAFNFSMVSSVKGIHYHFDNLFFLYKL